MYRTGTLNNIFSFCIICGSVLAGARTASGLTGTVRDAAEKPVTGAVVRLLHAGTVDTTGTDGRYELSAFSGITDPCGSDVRIVNALPGPEVVVTLQRTGPVRITLHAQDGRMLAPVLDASLPAGTHAVPLPAAAGYPGIRIVNARIGTRTYAYKVLGTGAAGAAITPLARPATAVQAETLVVTHPSAPGYRVPVPDPDGELDAAMACTTAWLWARGIHGPSIEDEIDAVASDAQGNVFATGKFEDTITVDGWDGELPSRGKADIMVVKYTVTGAVAWVRHFGGPGEDNIFDAVCDGEGNLIMNGWFEDTVVFDGDTLVSEGFSDVCVVKMDPAGNVVWALRCGGTAPAGGNEVSIGPDDQIIACADSKGAFRAGDHSYDPGLSIYSDSYVMSVSPGGVVEWVGTVGGSGMCRAKALNADSSGNVYLGGDFMGEVIVNYDADAETLAYNAGDSLNAYMTSWTPDGKLRWTKAWGGTGNDLCKGVVVNSHNDVYLVGQFEGTAVFGGDTLYGTGRDLFVWQLDTAGASRWLRHITSPQNLAGAEVELDADGSLLFGTGLSGPALFGTAGGAADTVTPPGSALLWPVMVRYDREGTLDFTAFAGAGTYGRLGEISRSGDLVFFDVAYNLGPHTFGPDELYSDGRNNKDAGIAVISIHE